MLTAPRPVRTALCPWHACRGCDSPCPAGNATEALSWLRGFKPDTLAMLDLRRAALDAGCDLQLSRFDDEAVLAQLAALIASGRLRVCGEPVQAKAPADSGAGSGAPEPPAPEPPGPKPKPKPKPKPEVVVTVVIEPSQPVACPGHPLPIKAVGKPGGGTYAWTFSGGTNAKLVDGARKVIAKGPNVNLLGYKPNDTDGSIPAQDVSLTVTYTHPNGTATDTKTVPIHKIEFDVTNTAITGGVTEVRDQPAQSFFGNAPGVATMSTDPKVKIKLDAACPRKAACAANHRVGWLQTMLTTVLRIRYTNTQISWSPPSMPIRDTLTGAPVFPFYGPVTAFTGDNDERTAHHEDSPGNFGVGWVDTRAASPAPPPATRRQLQRVTFRDTFTAWLVVQNIEWAVHDLPGSFAYQRHFNWNCALDYAVDTTVAPAVGGGSNRCAPQTNPAGITPMAAGKGSNPVLTVPIYNTTVAATTTAIP